MKRLWKSTATLLMSAAFVVSGVACGTDSTSSIGGDSSSTSASSALSGYVSGALEQLSSAESVKLTIAANMNQSTTEGTETTWSFAGNVQGEVILSQTKTGTNIYVNYKTTYLGDEEDEEYTLYLIDDCLYKYDDEVGIYEASRYSSDSMDGISGEVLDTVFETILGELETIDTEDIVETLVALLDEYGTVNETSASISLSYDAKTLLNTIITFINGIDEKTKTLEEAIDAVLALVGEVKTADILDAMKPFGAYTLSQVATKIDTILSDYDISLKDIKDAALGVVGDEMLGQLVSGGMLTQAQVTLLKTGTIQEILNTFGLADMTVNQLIGSLIASGNDDGTEAAFDLANFIENTVKPYLKNTTLAEAEIYMPPLDGVTVNKAKASADIVLGKESIDKLELSGELGMVQRETSEDNVVSSSSVDVSMKVALKELSSSPVVISLPENAKIVWNINSDELVAIAAGDCSAKIWFGYTVKYTDDVISSTSGCGGITVYSNEIKDCYIYYDFSYEPLSVSNTNVINIVVSRADVHYDGTTQVLNGDKLKEFLGKVNFELKIENGSIDLSAFTGIAVNEEENWSKFY